MDSQEYWRALQEEASRFLDVPIGAHHLKQFQDLYTLLLEANKVMNLTRITSISTFCQRHILDSLTLLPLLKGLPETASLIDIGSGAGFPALPLAIMRPKMRIVAVESVQKKARFIEQTAQVLMLGNVQVIAERSELLGHRPEHRGQYDAATARAVSRLNVLAELCLPFLKKGGVFLAMKTASAVDVELSEAKNAIAILGGSVEREEAVRMPGLENHRVVIVRKTGATPTAYPRRPGIPEKTPL